MCVLFSIYSQWFEDLRQPHLQCVRILDQHDVDLDGCFVVVVFCFGVSGWGASDKWYIGAIVQRGPRVERRTKNTKLLRKPSP